LRAAKPSGAHQHTHPARSHPGGSAACAAPCLRASEWSPVKFGRRCAQWATLPWRPRDFTRPAFGAPFRRCGGRVCALDRTKCQAGVWLAFGSGKCGWLRALTPRVCARVRASTEWNPRPAQPPATMQPPPSQRALRRKPPRQKARRRTKTAQRTWACSSVDSGRSVRRITSLPRALRRKWARSRMGRRRHDKATGHRHARNGSRGDSQVCVECLC